MTATARLNLVKDNRGAIMVIGIFFACMMIGWMWFMIGLGDSIIWRDRSQEAADAAAYTSAAVQAQGMNLISFVNIIMFVMAILYLALAFIYSLLDLLHVIFGSTGDGKWFLPSSCGDRAGQLKVLSMVPYVQVVAKPLQAIWKPSCQIVAKLHDGGSNGAPAWWSIGGILGAYETIMVDTMPLMSDFQDLIAYASPWAGSAMSVYVSTQYKDWGQDRFGVALSASLMPATFTPGKAGNPLVKRWTTCDDEECKNPADCSTSNTAGCNTNNGGDKREGLPVAIPTEGFTNLCDHAGSVLQSAITGLTGKFLPSFINSAIGFILGKLTSAFTDDYCKNKSTGMFSGFQDIIEPIITKETAIIILGGLSNNETCPHQSQWGGGDDKGGVKGGPGGCEGVYQMQYKNKPFWEDPINAGGPHLVVDYAENGNDWMQVWSFVWGGNDNIYQGRSSAQRLVGVAGMDSATGGGTWNTNPGDESSGVGGLFDFYIAQSEFYFDCDAKWGDDACNKDSNASYNIGWRARLRRVHGVSWGKDLLGLIWGAGMNPSSGLQTRYDQIVSATFTNPIAQFAAKKLMNKGITWVYNAGNSVGGAINAAESAPDFIH